jgi:hypothetical protein
MVALAASVATPERLGMVVQLEPGPEARQTAQQVRMVLPLRAAATAATVAMASIARPALPAPVVPVVTVAWLATEVMAVTPVL